MSTFFRDESARARAGSAPTATIAPDPPLDRGAGVAMTMIGGRTSVFGILADPIEHMQAPQHINRLLCEEQFDGVMVPIHVRAEDLPAMVDALRRMRNLRGFVVTVPHKTAMATLCDDLSADATCVGAVNVVRRRDDGRLVGALLDGEGFVAGLRGAGIEPAGLRAYVAGAGGAASAIALSLARSGVRTLTIANRTRRKAATLVERLSPNFGEVAIRVGNDDPSEHDLVINATSLGLRPGDALPLDVDRLRRTQVVAEIVMDPRMTPLLDAARAKGCRIHFGAPMLACQLRLMARFMGVPIHCVDRAAPPSTDTVDARRADPPGRAAPPR